MNESTIWVAGEALIDLVPIGDSRVPIVGGGPANTAKALARLGIDTSFIGGISRDEYGELILRELVAVDLSKVLRSELPTARAIVTLSENGSATYEFKLEGTATFNFSREWLPQGKPDLLHIGTLASLIEPGASELFEWVRGLNVPIVFDPNIRPSVLGDRLKYRSAVERWFGISAVIKMSDEDLKWLGYSGVDELLDFGAKLVVITRGSKGISGYTSTGEILVPGVKVEVVDTVGAGDTVGAVIVEGILRFGLEELVNERLFSVLNRAAKAASITCSRAGANPPTLAELR